MSSEKLAPALCTETNVCQPNATVSSTVVTKRNQQVYTQQMITTSRIRKVNSSNDNDNSSPMTESSLITSPDFKNSHVDVKRTTKTYVRRIIRKIGPNGEVSEEIIEEGDPISSGFIVSPQMGLGNTEVPSITGSVANQDSSQSKITGGTKFQATAGFQSVSETGEQQSVKLSTGPMNINFSDSGNKILSLENKTNLDEADSNNLSLSLINNSGNSVQQVLPDGTIVTRTFYGEKSATVTHSSTINGQTLTSSKSAFMSFSGESMLEANSSINDMEMIFGKMMEGIKGSTLDVFNHFLTSGQNSMVDHLALAGGDMKCSLLALEAPPCSTEEHVETEKPGVMNFFKHMTKPSIGVKTPETINEVPATQPESIKITIDQQEEALIQQQIKAIKDSKASNRLYWSNMDEVKNSGILDSMQKEEIHLQEAIFEIITSEASYNISLDTLIEFYYKSELLNPNKADSIINAVEKHHLFSNILLIKTVSLKLLKDLENRWSQQKPKLIDLSDIILKHAEDKDFQQQYINYLTNQSYQINALKSLLQKENFKQALIAIQNNPQCCKLSLDSFLALPMQRLTRLKLLTDVVMKFMNHSKELYDRLPKEVVDNNVKAIVKLKELLSACEENKTKMEKKERLIDLDKILEYSGSVKKIPIVSMELIKEGEVRASSSQLNPNAVKKLSKKRQPTFYLIVLSELFIIAKKKSSTKLVVLEYCNRNNVEAIIHQNSVASTPGPKTSRASIGSQMSISSSSSIDSTPAATGQPFVLKFNNDSDSLLTESLVLTVPTCESREQWISAINSKEKL